MKTKHTKDPWYYREGQVASEFSVHGCTIATVTRTSKHIGDEEADANGKLMAAAPELLTALQSTLSWMEDCLMDKSAAGTPSRRAYDTVRHAIAKATGEYR